MYEENVFKYGTKAYIDFENKTVEIFSEPNAVYVPDFLATGNVMKYSQITSIKQNFESGVLDKPFRIGTGVTLIINGKYILLTQRDISTYTFKLKLNDFSGHLIPNIGLYDNSLKELFEELVIVDTKEKKLVRISPEVSPKREFEIIKPPTIDVKPEIKEIKAYVPKYIEERLFTIMYHDGVVIDEISKGYISYDPTTNALEITYPISIKTKIDNLLFLPLEPVGGIIHIVRIDQFLASKPTYYTPRVNALRELFNTSRMKSKVLKI